MLSVGIVLTYFSWRIRMILRSRKPGSWRWSSAKATF